MSGNEAEERARFEKWAIGITSDDPLDLTPCDNPSCLCGFHYTSRITAWAYEAFKFGAARAASPVSAPTKPRIIEGQWIYEDELPEGYPYHEMFEHSKLGPDGLGGVRIFPFVASEDSATQPEVTIEEMCGSIDFGHGSKDFCPVCPHCILEASQLSTEKK